MFQLVTALCRCLHTREMEYKITCMGTGEHRSTCVRARVVMGCAVCTWSLSPSANFIVKSHMKHFLLRKKKIEKSVFVKIK